MAQGGRFFAFFFFSMIYLSTSTRSASLEIHLRPTVVVTRQGIDIFWCSRTGHFYCAFLSRVWDKYLNSFSTNIQHNSLNILNKIQILKKWKEVQILIDSGVTSIGFININYIKTQYLNLKELD